MVGGWLGGSTMAGGGGRRGTSWERTSSSSPLRCRKSAVTSGPKESPTPRLLGSRPGIGWLG